MVVSRFAKELFAGVEPDSDEVALLINFYMNEKSCAPQHQEQAFSKECKGFESMRDIAVIAFGEARPLTVTSLDYLGERRRDRMEVLGEAMTGHGDLFLNTAELNSKFAHGIALASEPKGLHATVTIRAVSHGRINPVKQYIRGVDTKWQPMPVPYFSREWSKEQKQEYIINVSPGANTTPTQVIGASIASCGVAPCEAFLVARSVLQLATQLSNASVSSAGAPGAQATTDAAMPGAPEETAELPPAPDTGPAAMDIDGDIERELANQAAEPSPSAPVASSSSSPSSSAPKASAPAPSGAPKVSAFPPAQEPPPAQERRDAASTIKELMGKTFYEILGLDPGCSNAQIRKAFGKISLEYHPDKGGSTKCLSVPCNGPRRPARYKKEKAI
jgi:hypothetical protein